MLSESLRGKLEELLLEDEKVLWAESAVGGLHRGPYFFEEITGGILTFFIGLFIGKLTSDFILLSIVFIAASIILLCARFLIEPLTAGKTVYAVTDKRILFVYPKCYNQIAIPDIRVLDYDEKKNGIGHVYFVPRERYTGMGKRRRKDTSTKGCIFVNVPDVRKVYLLIALQRRAIREES